MNENDITLHPNPILCPTAELKCPHCGAPADFFKPDYGRNDYVESYECECRWELPVFPYADQISHLHHLWRTRIQLWKRLGRDYRDMATREYALTEYNAEAVKAMMAVEEGSQIFLHGPGGGGKTHLTIKAAVAMFAKGLTVEYWSELDFFEEARKYAVSNSDIKVKPGREGDILILEDLGKNKPSEYAAQMLYDVLEFRVSNRLGLIIVSNHSPSEAAKRMVLDAHNAGAVESRLKAGKVIHLQAPVDNREGSRNI